MKFLVIAALVSLLLLLLYSRLYPYFKILKKILNVAKTLGDSGQVSGGAARKSTLPVDNQLVRCVSCGTWIPSDRAIGANSRGSIYCSRECLEKVPPSEVRKVAS
ncbi:MAG: hypothetical protein ABR501_14960 [Pyrinomonadaceae bacterium]